MNPKIVLPIMAIACSLGENRSINCARLNGWLFFGSTKYMKEKFHIISSSPTTESLQKMPFPSPKWSRLFTG